MRGSAIFLSRDGALDVASETTQARCPVAVRPAPTQAQCRTCRQSDARAVSESPSGRLRRRRTAGVAVGLASAQAQWRACRHGHAGQSAKGARRDPMGERLHGPTLLPRFPPDTMIGYGWPFCAEQDPTPSNWTATANHYKD
eukprot:g31537.t1